MRAWQMAQHKPNVCSFSVSTRLLLLRNTGCVSSCFPYWIITGSINMHPCIGWSASDSKIWNSLKLICHSISKSTNNFSIFIFGLIFYFFFHRTLFLQYFLPMLEKLNGNAKTNVSQMSNGAKWDTTLNKAFKATRNSYKQCTKWF